MEVDDRRQRFEISCKTLSSQESGEGSGGDRFNGGRAEIVRWLSSYRIPEEKAGEYADTLVDDWGVDDLRSLFEDLDKDELKRFMLPCHSRRVCRAIEESLKESGPAQAAFRAKAAVAEAKEHDTTFTSTGSSGNSHSHGRGVRSYERSRNGPLQGPSSLSRDEGGEGVAATESFRATGNWPTGAGDGRLDQSVNRTFGRGMDNDGRPPDHGFANTMSTIDSNGSAQEHIQDVLSPAAAAAAAAALLSPHPGDAPVLMPTTSTSPHLPQRGFFPDHSSAADPMDTSIPDMPQRSSRGRKKKSTRVASNATNGAGSRRWDESPHREASAKEAHDKTRDLESSFQRMQLSSSQDKASNGSNAQRFRYSPRNMDAAEGEVDLADSVDTAESVQDLIARSGIMRGSSESSPSNPSPRHGASGPSGVGRSDSWDKVDTDIDDIDEVGTDIDETYVDEKLDLELAMSASQRRDIPVGSARVIVKARASKLPSSLDLAPRLWTHKHVKLWLQSFESLQTKRHAQCLDSRGRVDGRTLLSLSEEGLLARGFSSVPQRRLLLQEIQILQKLDQSYPESVPQQAPPQPRPPKDPPQKDRPGMKPRPSRMIPDPGTMGRGLVIPDPSPTHANQLSVRSSGELTPGGGFKKKTPNGLVEITSTGITSIPSSTTGSTPGTTRPSSQEIDTPRNTQMCLVRAEELGRGAGGSVYKAVHVPTATVVALKCINVESKTRREQYVRELETLHKFRHKPLSLGGSPLSARGMRGPGNATMAGALGDADSCPFIVALHDAFTDPNENQLCLVLEYMNGGSLETMVKERRSLDEGLLAHIALSSLKGLVELGRRMLIHRDLKPSNILIDHKNRVKLSDFGIVRELDYNDDNARTFTGTIAYMAPERITKGAYSFSADIWSLGLTLFTLALGRNPLGHCIYDKMFEAMGAIQSFDPTPYMDGLSADLQNFIAVCCQQDPEARPKASDLLDHPWAIRFQDSAGHLEYPIGRPLYTPRRISVAPSFDGAEDLSAGEAKSGGRDRREGRAERERKNELARTNKLVEKLIRYLQTSPQSFETVTLTGSGTLRTLTPQAIQQLAYYLYLEYDDFNTIYMQCFHSIFHERLPNGHDHFDQSPQMASARSQRSDEESKDGGRMPLSARRKRDPIRVSTGDDIYVRKSNPSPVTATRIMSEQRTIGRPGRTTPKNSEAGQGSGANTPQASPKTYRKEQLARRASFQGNFDAFETSDSKIVTTAGMGSMSSMPPPLAVVPPGRLKHNRPRPESAPGPRSYDTDESGSPQSPVEIFPPKRGQMSGPGGTGAFNGRKQNHSTRTMNGGMADDWDGERSKLGKLEKRSKSEVMVKRDIMSAKPVIQQAPHTYISGTDDTIPAQGESVARMEYQPSSQKPPFR